MNLPNKPGSTLPQRSRARTLPNKDDISVALSEITHHELRSDLFKYKKGGVFIPSFAASTVADMQGTILRYFIEDFDSTSAAILNFLPGDEEFRVFSLPGSGVSPISRDIKFNSRHFTGITETMSAKPQVPTIYNDKIFGWEKIFPRIPTPTILILIPATLTNRGLQRWKRLTISNLHAGSLSQTQLRRFSTVSGTNSNRNSNPMYTPPAQIKTISTLTVLAYTTTTLPLKFLQESTWDLLIDACRLNGPLLVNGDRYEEKMREARRYKKVMFGVRAVEKHIQDVSGCANDIGLELQQIFATEHAVIYVVHQDGDEEVKLSKYTVLGPVKLDAACPDRASHNRSEFSQLHNYPAGCAGQEMRIIRINNKSDLVRQCGSLDELHSFGSCLVKNMMCVFIRDQTNDMSVVVELSNKSGGFTENDEEDAKLFASLVGDVFSSSVMLEYRRNAIRRNDITNKVVSNIEKVQFQKVQKLLDFQFRQSIYFSKRFYTIKFTFSELPKEQYTGVILFIFSELGFLKRWKMRKTTVIRFILALTQGYVENSYHNWKHACTVTHFAFYLLNEMELQKHGYVTDLEALSLIVACLLHDIGHRGLNNHFGVFADKDAKHLQSQETSLAERHHVALGLQILSTEECNILENMTDSEYIEFMELVQFEIIATDLTKHLIDRVEHFKTLKKFMKKRKEHRRVFLSLIMTASDMCETIKPWNDYIMTVKNIFFEFFEQGDEELRLGYTPTPIMDQRIAYIPYIELKFIDEIVRPVYEAISGLLPKTEEAIFKIDYFKELWLIATKVFDDHVLLRNPLEVLSVPEMKEECLKGEVNLELEKAVFNIRNTLDADILDVGRRSTLVNVTLRARSRRKMKNCARTLQSICCCRHRTRYNAEYIRRMRYEANFMEERSDEFEKRRIEILFPGEFDEKINPREEIDNLISPNYADKEKGGEVSGAEKVEQGSYTKK